jgi:hypothetical protein
MKLITLRVPAKENRFTSSPSEALVEKVLRYPEKFGDKGKLGGIALYCRPPRAEGVPISQTDVSESSEMRFYLGRPEKAMIVYSDTIINDEMVSIGDKGAQGEFIIEDTGGAEVWVKERNLISLAEAISFAKSFAREGNLSINFEFWETSPLKMV